MQRLLTIGQLLDQAWDTFWKYRKPLLIISAWFFVVTGVFVLGRLLAPADDATFLIEQNLLSPLQNIGLTVIALTGVILYLSRIWVGTYLITALEALNTGGQTTGAWKTALKKSPGVLVVSLLRNILAALSVIAIAPGFLMIWWGVNKQLVTVNAIGILLNFLGGILALVGIVTIGVLLSLAVYAYLLEGAGIIGSLKRSKQLIYGRFWQVLIRLLIPKALVALAWGASFIAVELLLVFVLAVLQNAFGGIHDILLDAISNAVTVGMLALWYPLLIVADFVLYKNLK